MSPLAEVWALGRNQEKTETCGVYKGPSSKAIQNWPLREVTTLNVRTC